MRGGVSGAVATMSLVVELRVFNADSNARAAMRNAGRISGKWGELQGAS